MRPVVYLASGIIWAACCSGIIRVPNSHQIIREFEPYLILIFAVRRQTRHS